MVDLTGHQWTKIQKSQAHKAHQSPSEQDSKNGLRGLQLPSPIAVKHQPFLTANHKIAMNIHLQKPPDSNFDSNASNTQLSLMILSEQQAINS